MPTTETPETAPPPARLLRRWDLGEVSACVPVGEGRSRRIDASAGRFLLREYTTTTRRELLFRHSVLAALAAAGLPVHPAAPARDGRTVLQSEGRRYALFPWAEGRRLGGLELSLTQCHRLGGLLGRVHAELDALTPPVQQSLLVPTPHAAEAVATIDGLLAALPADGDDFDALAERRLRERRALLVELSDHQPPEAEIMAMGHVHGDFHDRNLLYGWSGSVAAVLGWDRLRVAPLAGELVQAAISLFGHPDERGLDLDRVAAFLGGHAEELPLDPGQICSAVHRLWWERLCDFRPLRRRYLDHDRSSDHLFPGAAALVEWWTPRLDLTLDVFARPYSSAS
ncbi:aminoglycoside phosphotransferase [Actinomadura craniellae]|uniref:Aminoglycoside phosphotransferase n=1 Tax=Actinomadura craniellae TaxID=2231787 RepID=A0A365HAQ4_9ACTN|nr:phosphotransferase [Actinomadura craniellae]RAY16088.1 aminoglycoside phosphotransferase [Actinomadura craniellae]